MSITIYLVYEYYVPTYIHACMQSDQNHRTLNPQDAALYDFATNYPWEELVEKAADAYNLVDFSSLDASGQNGS